MKLIRVHCSTEDRERFSVYNLEIHPDMVGILKEWGIVDIEEDMVELEDLLRIKKIMRIKDVFGVNLTGATIIVDLLTRIEQMEDEIKRLQREQGS